MLSALGSGAWSVALRLAKLAAEAGCHGVVASAQEALLLRGLLPTEMLIVTPGTQLQSDERNDQARVTTPFDAIRWGASHIVVGRSISRSANPSETFALIQAQVVKPPPDRCSSVA